MGIAAYAVLFFSIVGCMTFGFVKWSRESTVPPVHEDKEDQNKAAV